MLRARKDLLNLISLWFNNEPFSGLNVQEDVNEPVFVQKSSHELQMYRSIWYHLPSCPPPHLSSQSSYALLPVKRSISSGLTLLVFLSNFHTKMFTRYTTMPM